MEGRFHVDSERVMALSRTYDGQRQIPQQLADKLAGAASPVDTGDLRLDSMTKEEMRSIATLLRQLSEALDNVAVALRESAINYQQADQDVSETFDQIGNDATNGASLREVRPDQERREQGRIVDRLSPP